MIPKRTQSPPQEHGDWRIPLDNPADAEHLSPPVTVWRRMQLRVEYLQSIPLGAGGYKPIPLEDEPAVQPIKGWARMVRLMLAWCVLLPLSVVMVYALLMQISQAATTVVDKLSFWLSVPVWYSLLGAGTFVALIIARVANPILVYIYVLGHELTHAIAAKLCMGRVQTLRIDLSGGYVETDADNLFIALSPYFVPLWMCCWLLVLWVVNWVYPFPEWGAWFYAGFGFWWCFHLYWTVWVIPREQPDMLENGLLFSLLLVMIMNIGILLVVLACFGVITPAGYGHDFVDAAQQIAECACALWQYLMSLAAA